MTMKNISAEFECQSSAITLSDMEVFLFPDLLYSLVLANILSPRIWRWREDPWFEGLDRMTPYRRILRLKQFIIDRYQFNLDLDTWGLTTKSREMERFRGWVDAETLGRSNALFGYEGDRYYFDIDIRRHFGLDKYTDETIPYWKTETIEAMDAFRFKPGYTTGAGECVSLSTLYAAALFVVCGIPLDDLFLMATPLHSQTFVTVKDGILTNNRRLLTKAMWFNGTELTVKAQRALRHEQVTIVSHHTGYRHVLYPESTIDPAAFDRFRDHLNSFLQTGVTQEILAHFLRQHAEQQTCFQIRHERNGRELFLPAEVAYHYEHSSPYKVSDATRAKLLDEIDEDEFYPQPIEGRMLLNRIDDLLRRRSLDLSRPEDARQLAAEMNCTCLHTQQALQKLAEFVRLKPRLPEPTTRTRTLPPLGLTPAMSRDEIQARLEAIRSSHPVADLTFYAYRDLSRTDWKPYLHASLERSPVCIQACRELSDGEVADRIAALPSESIYDGPRAAHPDEVWNFGRGDGFEKAVCLATIWKARHPEQMLRLEAEPGRVRLSGGPSPIDWPSAKLLKGGADL
jgi:hypothetical protein